jgi:receptor expression-enhancing protein 5/6
VFESAVNAVYWFRKSTHGKKTLANSAAFYYTFKFVLVLWMALPQTR